MAPRGNNTHTPEYGPWSAMKGRCYTESDGSYRNYGARGIKVCERWRNSFENFLADMGPRPSPQHAIERINNNGDYEPQNCRWATPQEQANNRRNNRMVIYRGSKMSLRDAIRSAGDVASKETVRRRLTKLGWPVDRAVETPAWTITRWT